MYEGYLTFAGVEIGNVARTKAYVDRLLPSLDVRLPGRGRDLTCILGDGEYRTPALDNAPWYSPSRPDSANFYGFYPTSIRGMDDNTRSVQSTQLTGDGAVTGRPRHASKEVTVRGTLIAGTEPALEEGQRWLTGALEGGGCRGDDCSGDSMCYLEYLPECCNYADQEQFPVVVHNSLKGEGWTGYKQGFLEGYPGSYWNRVRFSCNGDGIQLQLDNLIPGESYRFSVVLFLNNPVDLWVNGEVVKSGRTRHPLGQPNGWSEWVSDFVPVSTSASIRITSAMPDCANNSFFIGQSSVVRTGVKKGLLDADFSDVREIASWVPETAVPARLRYSFQDTLADQVRYLEIEWSPGASGTTFDRGRGFTRIITGLTPGVEYEVPIRIREFALSPDPDDVIQNYGFRLGLFLDGEEIESSQASADWIVGRFTASSTEHRITIASTEDWFLPAGPWARMGVLAYRVDVAETGEATRAIDQAKPARRTVYNATLLEGPRVVSVFPNHNGFMKVVEFTMEVGHPFSYSDLVEVPRRPSNITYQVGEQACELGFPVRRNLYLNPRVAGTVGSIPRGGVESMRDFENDFYDIDRAFITDTHPFPNTAQAIRVTPGDPPVTSGPWLRLEGLSPGRVYTLSMDVGVLEPIPVHFASNPGPAFYFYGNGGVSSIFGNESKPFDATRPGWERIYLTVAFATNLDFDEEILGTASLVLSNPAAVGAPDAYFANIMIEEVGAVTDYFDGTFPMAEWEGTPNESASRWTKQGASIIVDPDCPPIPAPPRPPAITSACPIDVEEWRRYVTPIPSEESGGWRESVPVIGVTTSELAARDLRVRFYANPFGMDFEALNPCDYCGEFFVTYIPPNTTLTINGILRQVTAEVSGSESQMAMNLVSNGDGGPAKWPTLSCDTDYYMVVDVAPGEIANLDVRLSMAKRG